MSTSTGISGCFQPGQAKVVLGPTPLAGTLAGVRKGEKRAAISPESSKTKRCREGPGLALLASAHTDIWLGREDLGTSPLLCPANMFRQGVPRMLLLEQYS